MKNLFLTIICLLTVHFGFAQFQYDKIYAAQSEDGATKYFRIYDDGTVLMVNTKDAVDKVKGYFTKEGSATDGVVLYKSQSKIKDGNKASFVLENDGTKINCIAQGQGDKINLVMLSPSSGKQEKEFTVIK